MIINDSRYEDRLIELTLDSQILSCGSFFLQMQGFQLSSQTAGLLGQPAHMAGMFGLYTLDLCSDYCLFYFSGPGMNVLTSSHVDPMGTVLFREMEKVKKGVGGEREDGYCPHTNKKIN